MSSSVFRLGISILAIDNFSNKFGHLQANLGKIDKWANNVNAKMRDVVTPFNVALIGGAFGVNTSLI